MSSLLHGLVGLLMQMNHDDAVLTKIMPKRPSNGEPIGGVVVVSKEHWPAVEMLIDEYNNKHAGAQVQAVADIEGNVSEFTEEDRQRYGIGG